MHMAKKFSKLIELIERNSVDMPEIPQPEARMSACSLLGMGVLHKQKAFLELFIDQAAHLHHTSLTNKKGFLLLASWQIWGNWTQ